MSVTTPRTAVLLFSLPASVLAERKRLLGGKQREQRVWERLTRLTIAKVRAAGLPCVQSATLPTTDYTRPFGEQLQTAVQAVLTNGYDHVIVIGDDCPDLRVADLRQAASALNDGQLPVGCDQREGVFLFGLDRRFLHADPTRAFAQLPWQMTGLSAALTGFLSATFGEVSCLLTTRADWNERADLRAGTWLRGAFAGLARQLWALLAPVLPVRIAFSLPSFRDYGIRRVFLRGPPVA